MEFIVEKYPNPIVKQGFKEGNFFSWDTLWAYHPSLISYKNTYYLFYTGRGIFGRGDDSIGLATSKDLKKWNKSKIPILAPSKDGWDSHFVSHCFVFKDKNRFYMLYDGSSKKEWAESIGLATSRDLLNWEKYEKNPIFHASKFRWENTHVSRSSIFKENGFYYIFYSGHDGKVERIGVAKGQTLLTLNRFLDTPILEVGKKGEWDEYFVDDPRVIKHKGRYIMFYTGSNKELTQRIGVATSDDLVHWKKYKKNPIVDTSPNGWDCQSIARSDIRLINGDYYIFYSGKTNFFYSYSIGYLKIRIL